jgi:hypothetical protein
MTLMAASTKTPTAAWTNAIGRVVTSTRRSISATITGRAIITTTTDLDLDPDLGRAIITTTDRVLPAGRVITTTDRVLQMGRATITTMDRASHATATTSLSRARG